MCGFESDSFQLVSASADGSGFSDLHVILSDIFLLSNSFDYVFFRFCCREFLLFEDSVAKKLCQTWYWVGQHWIFFVTRNILKTQQSKGLQQEPWSTIKPELISTVRWATKSTLKHNIGCWWERLAQCKEILGWSSLLSLNWKLQQRFFC